MEPLLIALVVIAAIAFGYYTYQYNKKRREGFLKFAAENNFKFDPNRDRQLARRFAFLDKLNKGSNRYVYDYLAGDYEGYSAEAFTFHYETYSTDSKGNRRTHHHHVGVVAITIEKNFPELRIHPESFLSKIGQALGYDDIDFESVEFSKKFTVRSRDKKLAYDFCHTGMMEYLLANPRTALELDGDVLALYDGNRLEPHELPGYLQQLSEIRALMPEYLFRK